MSRNEQLFCYLCRMCGVATHIINMHIWMLVYFTQFCPCRQAWYPPMADRKTHALSWGRLKRSACAVQLFGRLSVVEPYFKVLWASLLFGSRF